MKQGNQPQHPHDLKKPNLPFKLFKWFVLFVLPSVKLIPLTLRLFQAGKIEKHAWFKKQILRNIVVATLISLPLVFGSYSAYDLLFHNYKVSRSMKAVPKLALRLDIKNILVIQRALTRDPDVSLQFQVALALILCGGLLGTFVVKVHPLNRQSAKLSDLLLQQGVSALDGGAPMALYTPLGILMDVSGRTPKEIIENERIWMALNISVKGYSEDPSRRSIIFIKKSFDLKSRYFYE